MSIRLRLLALIHLITIFGSANSTLIQTIIVARHSDRTPIIKLPRDTTGDIPGHVTAHGLARARVFGKQIRQIYGTGSGALLSKSYKQNEIYVRSSDTDRASQTAQAIVDGIYGSVSIDREENGNDVRRLFESSATSSDTDRASQTAQAIIDSLYENELGDRRGDIEKGWTVKRPLQTVAKLESEKLGSARLESAKLEPVDISHRRLASLRSTGRKQHTRAEEVDKNDGVQNENQLNRKAMDVDAEIFYEKFPPVPIHTVPKHRDFLMKAHHNCPAFDLQWSQFASTSEFAQGPAEPLSYIPHKHTNINKKQATFSDTANGENKEKIVDYVSVEFQNEIIISLEQVLKRMVAATGLGSVDHATLLKDFDDYSDPILVLAHSGRLDSPSSGLSDVAELYPAIKQIADWQWEHKFFSPQCSAFCSGVLMSDIFRNMNKATQEYEHNQALHNSDDRKDSTPGVVIYVGHDQPIMGMLYALQPTGEGFSPRSVGKVPPFLANFIIELHASESNSGIYSKPNNQQQTFEFSLKFKWNLQDVIKTNCEMCSTLIDFQTYLKDTEALLSESEWVTRCGGNEGDEVAFDGTNSKAYANFGQRPIGSSENIVPEKEEQQQQQDQHRDKQFSAPPPQQQQFNQHQQQQQQQRLPTLSHNNPTSFLTFLFLFAAAASGFTLSWSLHSRSKWASRCRHICRSKSGRLNHTLGIAPYNAHKKDSARRPRTSSLTRLARQTVEHSAQVLGIVVPSSPRNGVYVGGDESSDGQGSWSGADYNGSGGGMHKSDSRSSLRARGMECAD